MILHSENCLCGAVRFDVRGAPLRIGLCHSTDCRKESGSAFLTFAVWPRHAFSSTGDFSTHAGRSFCPACGSRLFCLSDEEAELRVGSLDMAPTVLEPPMNCGSKEGKTGCILCRLHPSSTRIAAEVCLSPIWRSETAGRGSLLPAPCRKAP